VQAIAPAGDGSVFDLNVGGHLFRYAPVGGLNSFDTNVQAIAPAGDGNLYVLHTDSYLNLYSPDGTLLHDFGVVQSFALGGDGYAYYLQNGTLYHDGSPGFTISSVQSFGVRSDGNLYVLHTDSYLNLYSPDGTLLYDFGVVQAFATASDGSGYFLQNGNLTHNSPLVNVTIATGVQAFAIGDDGNVYYLQNGNLYNGTSGAQISLGDLSVTQQTVATPYSGAIAINAAGSNVTNLAVTGLPSGWTWARSGDTITLAGMLPGLARAYNFGVSLTVGNLPWAVVREPYTLRATPGLAASFEVLALPAPVGRQVSIAVVAQDAQGNNTTSYSGPVTLTSSNAQVLPWTTTTVYLSGGAAQIYPFALQAGTTTLTATAGSLRGSGILSISSGTSYYVGYVFSVSWEYDWSDDLGNHQASGSFLLEPLQYPYVNGTLDVRLAADEAFIGDWAAYSSSHPLGFGHFQNLGFTVYYEQANGSLNFVDGWTEIRDGFRQG
jgi:hypothetical protein